MNPLKEFKEWYERRHPIVKGIGIILLVFLFLVLSVAFLVLTVPFIIVGFITLFIVLSIHGTLSKRVLNFLYIILSLPMLMWGFTLLMVIIAFWQVFLSSLLFIGVAFIIWKLRKWKQTRAWELEDQLKELKEQVSRGAITQEEYEQRKKKLLEKSEVPEYLDFEVTYENRETLQDQLKELKEQLDRGAITQEEYKQKKKKLLEKSQG